MDSRGVTRPMALEQLRSGLGTDDEPSRDEKLIAHHRQTLWIPWTVVLLGIWMLLAPATLGYRNAALWADPSGGRGVWFADDATHTSLRVWLMVWSDLVSGALLVCLGWRSLRPNRPVSWWAACAVGVWLVFAPVVLWSPSAGGYLNSSLVGVLVIALTILIPGMPNMVVFMQMGEATPPGWSYNPSSWAQRAVLIALGFAGLMVSRYLAAFQLGYIDSVWDPFFGFRSGTEPVLNSDMSHMWPISDAALGGVAYSFEFLMGFMGGPARWRTMPWMVSMFGFLVIPLGLSHIALVMSQPSVVHHWSTLALAAGAVMLPMITLTVDEVVAMGQHVRQAVRRGDRQGSAWAVFWKGGSAEGCSADERSPEIVELHDRPGPVIAAGLWGAGLPWNLVAVTGLGLWLLAAPAVFDISIRSGAADVAHIGGAVVVVVAMVSLAEVVRVLRFVNLAAAAGIVGCVLVTESPAGYGASVAATAAAIAVLSWRRGRVRDSYGSWTGLLR